MRVRAPRRDDANIPTGSMADIAFLLIIFFMVTTVHEVDRTSVNLPGSTINKKAEQGAAVIVLYTEPNSGELIYKFSDGEQMSLAVPGLDEIYLEASRLMYNQFGPGPQFMVKAQGDLPFEKVDGLLDTLRKAGVKRVLLLTQAGKDA